MTPYSGTIQGRTSIAISGIIVISEHIRPHRAPPGGRRDASLLRKEVTHGPLRCADVPLYVSGMDSHAPVLSFPPTLVVAGVTHVVAGVTHVETVDRPVHIVQQTD